MAIIEDWQINDKIESCHGCGTRFEDGSDIVSALFEQGEAFIRRDYCSACANAEQLGEAFSQWRAKLSVSKPVKTFVDNEVIFDFFERLQESPEPSKKDFHYVLALMLMRKRLLKFVSIEKDGDNAYMVLRSPRRDKTYRVLERRLSTPEMDALNDEVAKVFAIPAS